MKLRHGVYANPSPLSVLGGPCLSYSRTVLKSARVIWGRYLTAEIGRKAPFLCGVGREREPQEAVMAITTIVQVRQRLVFNE